MAKPTISLMGATYSDVSGVELPTSGGGSALFPFVEGSDTVTQNGTYDVTALASLIVNVSGGGGASDNIETGTYIPSADIAKPTISFSKTHTKLPVYAVFADADGYIATADTNICWFYLNWEQIIGGALYQSTSSLRYGFVQSWVRQTNATTFSTTNANITHLESEGSNNNTYPRFHVTESAMMPYSFSSTRYWRKDRHYKWIAVWL